MKTLIISFALFCVAVFATHPADNVTSFKNDQQAVEVLQDCQLPYVIDFSATWCGPCRAFAPTFHQVAEEYQGKVNFYNIDIDKCKSIATQFRIQAVPTVIVINPKTEKANAAQGLIDATQLRSLIDSVL